jgi:hypothetical protein
MNLPTEEHRIVPVGPQSQKNSASAPHPRPIRARKAVQSLLDILQHPVPSAAGLVVVTNGCCQGVSPAFDPIFLPLRPSSGQRATRLTPQVLSRPAFAQSTVHQRSPPL